MSHRTVGRTDVELARELVDTLLRAGLLESRPRSSRTPARAGVHAVLGAFGRRAAKGVKFEKFERVDPTLPAIPPGDVKTFKVDVSST
jgi:hypothetical protein